MDEGKYVYDNVYMVGILFFFVHISQLNKIKHCELYAPVQARRCTIKIN